MSLSRRTERRLEAVRCKALLASVSARDSARPTMPFALRLGFPISREHFRPLNVRSLPDARAPSLHSSALPKNDHGLLGLVPEGLACHLGYPVHEPLLHVQNLTDQIASFRSHARSNRYNRKSRFQ